MKTKHTEIIIASILLLISLFEFVATAHKYQFSPFSPQDSNEQAFKSLHLQYDFVSNYLLPELLGRFTFYFSFLWMACSYPNKFIARRQWLGFVSTTVLGSMCTFLLLLLKSRMTGFYRGDALIAYSFYSALTFYGALLVYQAMKHAAIYFFKNTKQAGAPNPLRAEIVSFFVCWLIIMAGCFIMDIYWGWKLFFGFLLPCCFIVYAVLMYSIIPGLWHGQSDKIKFWLTVIAVTFLINLPFTGWFAYTSAYELWSWVMLFMLAWVLQLCVLIPLSIYIYYRRQAIKLEIAGLQTGLSRADADLSFLRSQIDPHFLFNALNTLYGVALKEKAQHTANGVQTLGDMMRFILHENNREQISLGHEVQYLQNYISLQKLRIVESDSLYIKVDIKEVEDYKIAPMLLIPFVENAFKHGISLKEPSWVTIKLYMADDLLHFEVNNGIHNKKGGIIHKNPSGIGLANVKKRLKLIYQGKHQIDISSTPTAYSIKLMIDLGPSS